MLADVAAAVAAREEPDAAVVGMQTNNGQAGVLQPGFMPHGTWRGTNAMCAVALVCSWLGKFYRV